MALEGFIALQHRGKYAIHNAEGIYRELNLGDRVEVDAGQHWLAMRVAHDFEGYYLEGGNISFYPKKVYARLVGEAGPEKRTVE